jgi:type IV secretory pathway protease TraF
MSGLSKRQRLVLGVGTLAACGMLAASMASPAPLFLYPITQSLPAGLYVRTGEVPTVATIAVFPVPEVAKRYKTEIGETVHEDFLFMKPIVAGPGDHVCLHIPNGLYLNGARIAQVVMKDGAGRSLPIWRGCRRLEPGELFTLSTHAGTSFDSRHYGPINISTVIGAYRPIGRLTISWTTHSGAGS